MKLDKNLEVESFVTRIDPRTIQGGGGTINSDHCPITMINYMCTAQTACECQPH